ncbi:DUF2520 domain-containing protein [candidate division WOR-3 bacterium]|nr:DUF2520 domain-containing protein [candidate division WOR-3 bacterium]
MNIGLVGCGKVGTTIFYLLKNNNKIIGVYDINKKNEKQALKLLHIKKNLSLKELCAKSQALFFATPDDQILVAYMKAKPFIEDKKYIFHFSGLLSSAIFPKSRNIYRGSIHPFATFPDIVLPPARNKYYLFVEGNEHALRAIKRIFAKRYFNIKKLKSCQKTKHHLLGVFSSNLLVGLVSAIYGLAKDIGWTKKEINDVIMPIIEETLHNIRGKGLNNALSGPLERGDIEVIKKHLSTLKKNKDLSNIYRTLSLVVLKNVMKGEKRKKIEELLNQ